MKIIITEDQLKKIINEGANTITGSGINKGVDIMSKLISKLGIGAKDAAAIAGNMWHESHFNAAALEKHPERANRNEQPTANKEWKEILNKRFKMSQDDAKTHDLTKGGYGLIQWTASRRRDIENYISRDQHPADIDTQIDFLGHELRGTESGNWKKVGEKNSIADKTHTFHIKVERSASRDSVNRIDAAEKIYDEYIKNGSDSNKKDMEIITDDPTVTPERPSGVSEITINYNTNAPVRKIKVKLLDAVSNMVAADGMSHDKYPNLEIPGDHKFIFKLPDNIKNGVYFLQFEVNGKLDVLHSGKFIYNR